MASKVFTSEDPPLPPVSSLFPYLHCAPSSIPASVDPFTITTSTGFLPFRHPVATLPPAFARLEELLHDLPIEKADGCPGLLATFRLGEMVDNGCLPDLTDSLSSLRGDGSNDLAAITAIFRDYSFLASAYLLEPCWESWSKDHDAGYGLGRHMLPKAISRPLVKAAEILDIPPFMSYAAAYALYNYTLADPKHSTSSYSNLRMIRAFERGLDHNSSEAGFVLTHVHMVNLTGPLIAGAMQLLSTIDECPSDRQSAVVALETMVSAMFRIEEAMESMWSHSLPKDYAAYRTFIFGITNQSMFPNGVVYEGCNNEEPMFFRGESGANDSIIPLLDHLLQVPMPANPLTDILKDFRSYRPKPHRMFLSYVMSKATELGVRKYACQDSETTILYLRLLNHVRSFRWRHWLFAREYIIRRSKHPTATGGSPIVTWLPNQLMAVMDLMVEVYDGSGLLRGANGENKGIAEMMDGVTEQRDKLEKEVKKWCQERGA